MSFLISGGNSTPSTTKSVFGMTGDYKMFNLDLNTATVEQQNICEDFFSLIGYHSSVNITNSGYNFEDCTYVLVDGVDSENSELDYLTLSNEEKEKINKFSNLLIEISN